MLIKLTHRGTPTLVNPNNIQSIYMDRDKKSGNIETKITFTNGVIFVDETMNEVMRIVWEAKLGKVPDFNFEVPTIDKRMEETFTIVDTHPFRKRNYPNFYKVDREINYNR